MITDSMDGVTVTNLRRPNLETLYAMLSNGIEVGIDSTRKDIDKFLKKYPDIEGKTYKEFRVAWDDVNKEFNAVLKAPKQVVEGKGKID